MARISKLSEEDKRTIVTAYQCGKNVKDIAADLGLDKSYAYKIIKEWKEHGENSFTETEETEKEPATAPTVTSSEENTRESISDDIVPDIGENVKPVIPEAVKEACWESIERLRADISDWKMSISLWEEKIKEMEDFIEKGKAGV